MWELDYKESWMPKNWCFWTVVLEKTLESPMDCKEIQSVLDQSWVFIGSTDVEAETPILWPPDVKNWLILKDPDAGKDWGQEEKGATEDEMVGRHHWLDGHKFEWAPGVCDEQGSLTCCSLWGRRVGHSWVTKLIMISKTCLTLFFPVRLEMSIGFYSAMSPWMAKLYGYNCMLIDEIQPWKYVLLTHTEF